MNTEATKKENKKAKGILIAWIVSIALMLSIGCTLIGINAQKITANASELPICELVPNEMTIQENNDGSRSYLKNIDGVIDNMLAGETYNITFEVNGETFTRVGKVIEGNGIKILMNELGNGPIDIIGDATDYVRYSHYLNIGLENEAPTEGKNAPIIITNGIYKDNTPTVKVISYELLNETITNKKGNLINEPITIDVSNKTGTIMENYDFSLGLQEGKIYKIKANVDGEDVEVYGLATSIGDGAYMLTPIEEGEFIKFKEGISFICADNCAISTEESNPHPEQGKCIFGIQLYQTSANIITINSITEKIEPKELTAGTIIGEITESTTGLLTGIGTGIVNLFETMFLTEEGKLSVFAIVSLTMLGLGIAMSLVTWIRNKI